MSKIDTSAEAVERKAAWMTAYAALTDLPAAVKMALSGCAATLRALLRERDEQRQRSAVAHDALKVEVLRSERLRTERDAARAEVERLLADAARLACVVTGTLPDKNTMTAEECEQVENEAHDCAHRIMREYEQHMRQARAALAGEGRENG